MKESNKNTREESKKEERNEREQQNISQKAIKWQKVHTYH